MSKTSLHWCNYCATPFHSKRYLSQHQQRCKTCKRYRDVLFCCERCGEFKTKGINNLHKHLESCTGEGITPPVHDIGTLETQLAAEKVRSSIYLALLTSHTNIDISSILEKKDGDLHLFDVTPGMKIFLHEKSSDVVLILPLLLEKSHKQISWESTSFQKYNQFFYSEYYLSHFHYL